MKITRNVIKRSLGDEMKLKESHLMCLYEICGLEPSVPMFDGLEEQCDGTMFTQ